MRVFHSLESAKEHFGPCALAIGNFDGVHIGHQALLTATAQYAHTHRLCPAVLTFEPHPTAVVAPHRKPEMTCSLEDRIRLLFAAGAERILVLPFTEALAKMTPREFVADILVAALESKAIFVGQNFRFGHKQYGTPETLSSLSVEFGFEPYFLPPVFARGEVVSSSAIRLHLSSGEVLAASRLLGRCFFVSGKVVSGHGVGSKQTVPTLNLKPTPGLLYPRGVFVTETLDKPSSVRWPSITNVGVRPTFGGNELTVETYLLSPLEGEPPADIEVQFRHFVRGERHFSSPELLRAQIVQDVARAQSYWRKVRRLTRSSPSIY